MRFTVNEDEAGPTPAVGASFKSFDTFPDFPSRGYCVKHAACVLAVRLVGKSPSGASLHARCIVHAPQGVERALAKSRSHGSHGETERGRA